MSIKPTAIVLVHLVVTLGFSALYWSSIRGFGNLAQEKKWLNSDTNSDLWEKASKLFFSRKEEIKKDSEIHSLFEKFSNSITQNQLKEACVKGYEFTYKNLFFEDRVLFKNLNTFCRLKNREVFEENNLIKKDSEESELLSKANNILSSHNDKEHGKKGDNVTRWSDWKSYVEWCDKWYEFVYGGDDSRSWKLATRYCNKTELNKNTNN